MKPNNSLMIMSVLSLFIILLGSTFSYFNISARSNPNDMSLTAMNFDTSVEVTALHNDKSLIPMDDSDVMKAYSQNCIDDDGYGACQAYNIEITNNGLANNYDGIVFFSDYSWYDGNVYVENGEVTNKKKISNNKLEEKNYYISYITKKNDLALKYNYLKKIKDS